MVGNNSLSSTLYKELLNFILPAVNINIIFTILKVCKIIYLKTWICREASFVLSPANPGIFI